MGNRAAVAQHQRQLNPPGDQIVEVPQPVADVDGVGRIEKYPHVGRHDDASGPPFKVAGINEDADYSRRSPFIEGKFLGYRRR